MNNTGTLMVRVYTSQAQLPLEGATVVVTGPGMAGKVSLLSVQATDSSGKIRPVTLNVPGREPYALCTIWVEHPSCIMARVEGVQVFPGVETLQELELIPLAEGQSSLQQINIGVVIPQDL